ncbi:hypothetical protein, partial [Mesorhizobium sp. M1A.F.Ca.IN.020.32.1.1]|uniref:hypothetical protein n=1 Tax=Mesorhizobium sp. M1A.F.Ca.IN.020.32.1.1 TaxID=2496763 RepID=UPI0019D4DCA5
MQPFNLPWRPCTSDLGTRRRAFALEYTLFVGGNNPLVKGKEPRISATAGVLDQPNRFKFPAISCPIRT